MVGRRPIPVLEVGTKLYLGQMPGNAGHGDLAVTPRVAKVISKRIVLDVLNACIMLWRV